jgi:RNA polymerase sigma-70 factor (ECF subfamily)
VLRERQSIHRKIGVTDWQLIREVLGGNRDAFRLIVERYQERIAATVYGMLGVCPEAEDVGQEVFVRFYKTMDKFRGDAELGTYLTRIAINLSLNELKRRKRQNVFIENEDVYEQQIADEDAPAGYDDLKEFVQQKIALLPPKYRSVLVLRLIDGYSIKETSTILHIPVGTVLSRLARAQKRMRSLLQPLLEEQI